MVINWDDPDARFALIQRVGVTEYSRLMREHHARNAVVATVNGHAIRQVQTRFGRVFEVAGVDRAFATLDEAEAYAREVGPPAA